MFKTIAFYNENVHDRVSRAGETHVFSPSAVNSNKNDEGGSLQGGRAVTPVLITRENPIA